MCILKIKALKSQNGKYQEYIQALVECPKFGTNGIRQSVLNLKIKQEKSLESNCGQSMELATSWSGYARVINTIKGKAVKCMPESKNTVIRLDDAVCKNAFVGYKCGQNPMVSCDYFCFEVLATTFMNREKLLSNDFNDFERVNRAI